MGILVHEGESMLDRLGLRLPERLRYLAGCGLCSQGTHYLSGSKAEARRLAHVPNHLSIPEEMVLLVQAGQVEFCTCEAGQVAQKAWEKAVMQNEEWHEGIRRHAQEMQQRRLDRLFDGAQVPPRFADFTLNGYVKLVGRDEGKADAIGAIKQHFSDGKIVTRSGVRYGLWLYGHTDMGKTGMLCPLFLHYIREGRAGLWVQYNDMLASLRDFNRKDVTVEDRVEALQKTEYLMVDDWGDPLSEKGATDYQRDNLFRIIDYRTRYMKPTFVTSNLRPEQLKERYHERMVKRIGELCAVIEVGGLPMREYVQRDIRIAA